jgi:hypothetical protein
VTQHCRSADEVASIIPYRSLAFAEQIMKRILFSVHLVVAAAMLTGIGSSRADDGIDSAKAAAFDKREYSPVSSPKRPTPASCAVMTPITWRNIGSRR